MDWQLVHGDAVVVRPGGQFPHGQVRLSKSFDSGEYTVHGWFRDKLVRELDGGSDIHIRRSRWLRPVLVFRGGGGDRRVLLRQEEIVRHRFVRVRERHRDVHLRPGHAVSAGRVRLARHHADTCRPVPQSRGLRLFDEGPRVDHHQSEGEDRGETEEQGEEEDQDTELERGLVLRQQFAEHFDDHGEHTDSGGGGGGGGRREAVLQPGEPADVREERREGAARGAGAAQHPQERVQRAAAELPKPADLLEKLQRLRPASRSAEHAIGQVRPDAELSVRVEERGEQGQAVAKRRANGSTADGRRLATVVVEENQSGQLVEEVQHPRAHQETTHCLLEGYPSAQAQPYVQRCYVEYKSISTKGVQLPGYL